MTLDWLAQLDPIVGFIAGLFGSIAALIGIIKGVLELRNWYRRRVGERMSWKKVEEGVLKIIGDMRRDAFMPDLVIGIGRSGAILGGLIAGNMGGTIPIVILDRQFRWDTNMREDIPVNFTELQLDDSVKNVLVVLGEVYSGKTPSEALRRLEPILKGKRYKLASLVKIKTASVKVDYYLSEVEKQVRPAWVITDEYYRPTA